MPVPVFSGYPTPPNAPEPLEYGNINIMARRAVKIVEKPKGTFKIDPFAKNGSFEWGTVLSIVVGPLEVKNYGKSMVVLPSISDDGTRILSAVEATKKFEKDGLHLGIFDRKTNVVRTATETTLPANRKFLAEVYAEKISELERQRLKNENEILEAQDSSDSSKYDFSKTATPSVDFITKIFSIVGVEEEFKKSINERLTSLSVSYSMNQSTELSATFIDDDYSLTSAGYFDLRRIFSYRGRKFEISGTETGGGQGGSPQVSVNLQPVVVQELRRDKKPEAISGSSGYDYARRVAASKGLAFVGEKSNKQQTVFKGSGSSTDESVWDVLGRTSGDNQVSVFEVDGVLVYGSMNWMLWKFGLSQKTNKKGVTQKYLDLRYDPKTDNSGAVPQYKILRREYVYQDLDAGTGLTVGTTDTSIPDFVDVYTTVPDNGIFELTEWPRVRMSENDGLEGEGSCSVESPNGKLLRPGHTVFMASVPEHFRGGYLVTDVSFNEFDSEPVTVAFVTPQKPKNQQKPEE